MMNIFNELRNKSTAARCSEAETSELNDFIRSHMSFDPPTYVEVAAFAEGRIEYLDSKLKLMQEVC